ncbi:SDR family NAD(P)-dependent oxidoreductase [Candidatus Marimicrobium litorale]|uniref:SDR family NAD(P)-dependent oxidoreductase n=1 Tax=Candidatus Marimicrobium litorale TaxID=2518991 RepID=A0ABT3T8D1_9GAMM|nr:SDR family NAD(P)-dependent oxidoreductase [Candidatus Marimicrobium litorale]MCX2978533.1 SDR family NAD(P)-dependent oxidoreductase [Candidatus Marimicrobium litorale]
MVFTIDSTTDEIVAGLDLAGKVVVVTGASGGLGAETARAIASTGATVVLVARSAEKLEARRSEIIESTGNTSVHLQVVNLADLESVRSGADELLRSFASIDVLINNAGIMACPLERTLQGFESQLGVNHIAHFVFTNRLLGALKSDKGGRIVVLTSGAHKIASVDLDDMNWESREYDKWAAYGASKTANALFATELNRRFSSEGITANCVHPGVIMTDLSRSLTEDDFTSIATEGMKFKTVECGAATSVWAAVSPQLEGQGGYYLEDCHVGVELPASHMLAGYCGYALDNVLAKQLWQKTEKLLATIRIF